MTPANARICVWPMPSATLGGVNERAMFAACAAAWLLVTSGAGAQETAEALRMQAARAYYDLDYDEAEALYRRAIAVSPDDAGAHRGLATVQWLRIMFARGMVSVDEFIGGRPRHTVDMPAPDPVIARTFHEHANRALQIAERHARSHPRDPEALFQYGASLGLLAGYMATVEGRVFGAIGAARTAYDAHERVLELDARRKDAGLIVGTYRYTVSTLPLPGRWLAYLAGFGGGRQVGVRMIEEAAAYRSEWRREAQLALVLLYNRERRFDEALRMLDQLREAYPRNRLFWLESGATALRAGHAEVAERLLTEGLQRAERDSRPRAHGERALWLLRLGTARLARRNLPGAMESLRGALIGDARTWVHARAHLELGKALDLQRQRERAVGEYREAARLAALSRDDITAVTARRLQGQPFR